MALDPKSQLTIPVALLDSSNTTGASILVGSGPPDGDVDPMASAAIGTLYHDRSAGASALNWYCKYTDNDADDDWGYVLTSGPTTAFTIYGAVTMSAGTALWFRDSDTKIYSPSAAYTVLDLNTAHHWRIGDQGNENYVRFDYDGKMSFVGTSRIEPQGAMIIFDDFFYGTTANGLDEDLTPWIFNEGADGDADDPDCLAGQEGGAITLTTGSNDGTVAQDGSQIVCRIPVQADSTGLVFETRLHINTAITNVAVNAGFTDNQALEEPFTIGGGDAITSVATDAACFVYDTGADTDEWFACAVDSGADDGDSATTGTAPVADTYQTLRIEVDSDGNTVKYYIDGTLELTLNDDGVTNNTNLYATVIACGDGTASKTVDIDYIYVAHAR